MAKTRTPLHSLVAAGTYASLVTFSSAHARPTVVRRKPKTTRPPTVAQAEVRYRMGDITAALRLCARTTTELVTHAATPRALALAHSPIPHDWQNHFQAILTSSAWGNYTSAAELWATYDAPTKAAWQDAADYLSPTQPPVKHTDPLTRAPSLTPTNFVLFLCHYALSAMGALYLPTPPTAPDYGQAATPPAGIPWDGGATTWDAGATSWPM